ncbi:MAG: hypothetical protein JWQ73_17 [Variovorax sp.]|nr:hypothetical protein [Variovorax sp.]
MSVARGEAPAVSRTACPAPGIHLTHKGDDVTPTTFLPNTDPSDGPVPGEVLCGLCGGAGRTTDGAPCPRCGGAGRTAPEPGGPPATT